MKYLTKMGLLAGSALLIAGCGSDSDSSAGSAGGIYGSSLVADVSLVSAAIDESLPETFGVVNESGAAAFMVGGTGQYILWGSVSASVPQAPVEDDYVFAPIGGSFELYEYSGESGEHELVGSATINQGIIEEEDYCEYDQIEFGVDPLSVLRAYVDIDGDEGEPLVTDKEFCAEVTLNGIEGGPAVAGVGSEADLELYEGEGDGWSLADLETDPSDEWCDESSSTGLCVEVDANGVVTGDWDECVVSGQFSHPFADQGLNAFDFGGGDVCEGGDSGGFSGRAFLKGDVLAIFVRGDGGAAFLELVYQDNLEP